MTYEIDKRTGLPKLSRKRRWYIEVQGEGAYLRHVLNLQERLTYVFTYEYITVYSQIIEEIHEGFITDSLDRANTEAKRLGPDWEAFSLRGSTDQTKWKLRTRTPSEARILEAAKLILAGEQQDIDKANAKQTRWVGAYPPKKLGGKR